MNNKKYEYIEELKEELNIKEELKNLEYEFMEIDNTIGVFREIEVIKGSILGGREYNYINYFDYYIKDVEDYNKTNKNGFKLEIIENTYKKCSILKDKYNNIAIKSYDTIICYIINSRLYGRLLIFDEYLKEPSNTTLNHLKKVFEMFKINIDVELLEDLTSYKKYGFKLSTGISFKKFISTLGGSIILENTLNDKELCVISKDYNDYNYYYYDKEGVYKYKYYTIEGRLKLSKWYIKLNFIPKKIKEEMNKTTINKIMKNPTPIKEVYNTSNLSYKVKEGVLLPFIKEGVINEL